MFAWRRDSVQEERSERNNQSKLDGKEKEIPNSELDRRFQLKDQQSIMVNPECVFSDRNEQQSPLRWLAS
ncbi:hypothetical protein PAAG_12372 [Paracoccidioides lutzii Pb01]|uniref:Uncharacterized protein n=1 Tax=Paracoccidioides lutzii (strain ATCC MYA-826 / Pb01) TaxID=502779 RepID=A0A0A2V458_PARBA|nr:hypothetical protein PAAG_12372 [Paracoccidioides lutzii Pb01]KGQ00945.1 hypothetical protein PAAG_12372 [Paracoccidioides lutzii Pb01]